MPQDEREELAELNRKIANLISALEEGGYLASILDRLLELENQAQRTPGRPGRGSSRIPLIRLVVKRPA